MDGVELLTLPPSLPPSCHHSLCSIIPPTPQPPSDSLSLFLLLFPFLNLSFYSFPFPTSLSLISFLWSPSFSLPLSLPHFFPFVIFLHCLVLFSPIFSPFLTPLLPFTSSLLSFVYFSSFLLLNRSSTSPFLSSLSDSSLDISIFTSPTFFSSSSIYAHFRIPLFPIPSTHLSLFSLPLLLSLDGQTSKSPQPFLPLSQVPLIT